MTTLASHVEANKVVLLAPQRAILHLLVYHGIKTEHELVQQVVKQTNTTEANAVSDMGEWLTSLRRFGFVWTGILTNAENVGMWVAAATTLGKQHAKEHGI